MRNVTIVVLFVSTALVLLGSLNQEAFAVTKTWDMGAGTKNWSDPANWNPDGVPADGDDIVIPAPFEVIMDIDFTVRSGGSITIQPDSLLRVPKNMVLTNSNGMVTNQGFFFIDGKVVNTINDTIENRMGALLVIMGDGSANNGVFINDGTVNDNGNVQSDRAKWTNNGTYHKNAGSFELINQSTFTNDNQGIFNIIFVGVGFPADVTFDDSVLKNTGESIINVGTSGSITIFGSASLINELLSVVNINDLGEIDVLGGPGIINKSKFNVNPGGTLFIISFDAVFLNTENGLLTIQGAPGNTAVIEISSGRLTNNVGDINNNKDGVINIDDGGSLHNVSPSSLNNNLGAQINIKGGELKGRIFGTGGAINRADNSIVNFGIIDISGPWQNFGTIENEGIINVLCGGSIVPLGTIIGAGEFNEFECPVGGELIPLDTTALLLAGAQMNAAWMIPVIVAGIGFAIVIARKF